MHICKYKNICIYTYVRRCAPSHTHICTCVCRDKTTCALAYRRGPSWMEVLTPSGSRGMGVEKHLVFTFYIVRAIVLHRSLVVCNTKIIERLRPWRIIRNSFGTEVELKFKKYVCTRHVVVCVWISETARGSLKSGSWWKERFSEGGRSDCGDVAVLWK